MRFGIGVWADKPIDELVRICETAEALGFDGVWFNDHYFVKDVYVVQALAARRTERIRFGTSITSPFQRHPAQVASTVRDVARGLRRAALFSESARGGSSTPRTSGRPFPSPERRAGRPSTLSGGCGTYEATTAGGEVFSVKDARLEFGETLHSPHLSRLPREADAPAGGGNVRGDHHARADGNPFAVTSALAPSKAP